MNYFKSRKYFIDKFLNFFFGKRTIFFGHEKKNLFILREGHGGGVSVCVDRKSYSGSNAIPGAQ